MRAIALLLVAWASPAATFDYWVDPCAKPDSGCHRGDSQLAKWALEAWAEATGHKLIFRETFERAKAQIRVNWASGNQGLYGEARPIVVNGIRGAEVYVLPPAETPEDPLMRDAIVYLTCLHETGHALGLAHTAAFADIMYSFQFGGDIPEYFGRYRRQLMIRDDIHRHSGMSTEDRKRILELYR
ncbi:MAG: hypothetical protein JOZ22_20785 [Acidobacteriia bacterium]|nr:hypothetical protein [Terriglobia bacterium]MBV9745968.1 hypothetical protein [Terriglobia bacterium]